MKSILISNEVDKKLEALRYKLELSSNVEVIQYLLNYKEKRDFEKKLDQIFGL